MTGSLPDHLVCPGPIGVSHHRGSFDRPIQIEPFRSGLRRQLSCRRGTAHHLDTFNLFYSNVSLFYAPLHHYFIGALDLMYDHLRNGTPLPESQVIRTSPPKQKLPDISENPEVKDIKRFEDSQVKIPA
jgi:hypothetical protein